MLVLVGALWKGCEALLVLVGEAWMVLVGVLGQRGEAWLGGPEGEVRAPRLGWTAGGLRGEGVDPWGLVLGPGLGGAHLDVEGGLAGNGFIDVLTVLTVLTVS